MMLLFLLIALLLVSVVATKSSSTSFLTNGHNTVNKKSPSKLHRPQSRTKRIQRERAAALQEHMVSVGAAATTASARGLFSKAGVNTNERELTFLGLLFAGAVARSAAATAVHPLNVIKIMLQRKGGMVPEFAWNALMRGSGSQLIWSIPHGAFSFCVIEKTKKVLALWSAMLNLDRLVPQHLLNPLMDFLSSCVSTFICSVISTPQMVTTDRIMAGVYPNLYSAVTTIFASEGLRGFYVGWLPAMMQKIPSYALTWMLFQQLKTVFCTMYGRAGTAIENTMLGSAAAAGACSIMIPVDTIKTRIVTQHPGDEHVYTGGVVDTFFKILDAEGMRAFYRALPPRLLAVVPMIGIQFSTYELMKKLLLNYPLPK